MAFFRKGFAASAVARFNILALLAAATLCLLPDTALTADFKAEGAVGDRGDRDVCQTGEFVVGVRYRSGAWIDQVQIKCAILDPATGTLGSANARGRPRGGIGGVGGVSECPGGMWVRRIGFWFTDRNRQVMHVGAQCEFPAPNGRAEQFFTFGPRGGVNNVRHQCPPGEAAIGINTRSGKHLNALGLICGKTPEIGRTIRRVHVGLDLRGSDIANLIVSSANGCEVNCNQNSACRAWTWVNPGYQGPAGRCYLKNAVPRGYTDRCCTSGVKAQ